MKTGSNSFRSIWDALEETPEDADKMKARSELMICLREQIKSWKITQAEAAEKLKITQPRVSDLLNGRIAKFSIDSLFELATRAGLTPAVTVTNTAAAQVPEKEIETLVDSFTTYVRTIPNPFFRKVLSVHHDQPKTCVLMPGYIVISYNVAGKKWFDPATFDSTKRAAKVRLPAPSKAIVRTTTRAHK